MIANSKSESIYCKFFLQLQISEHKKIKIILQIVVVQQVVTTGGGGQQQQGGGGGGG